MRHLSINDDVSHSVVTVTSKGKVTGELVRVGSDCPGYPIDPIDVNKGQAQFHWDQGARNLKPGWYVLEIKVNGCLCDQLPVQIGAPCAVTEVEEVYRQPDCADECSKCGNLPVGPEMSCGCEPSPEVCEKSVCPPLKNNEPAEYVPAYRR